MIDYGLIHIFACTLPAVCGAYTGVRAAAKYERRAALLQEYISALTDIKIYIRNSTPLHKITAFRNITGEVSPEKDFFPAWEQRVRFADGFTDSDRDILYNLGAKLGKTDSEGQYAVIDAAKALLNKNLGEASETAAEKGGVCRRAGALIGILVSLILL